MKNLLSEEYSRDVIVAARGCCGVFVLSAAMSMNTRGSQNQPLRLVSSLGSARLPGVLIPMSPPAEQNGNISTSLEIIAKYVGCNPATEPVRFVLEMAHRWKERGGTVAGKPRHSDRYLNDLLRLQGTLVRSLTPKLANRTNLKPADAGALMRLFLSHWEYIGDANTREIGEKSNGLYRRLLPNDQIEAVSSFVADRISEVGVESRGEIESAATLSVPGQNLDDIVATEFRKAAAMFVVGAGQTVLVAQPEMALIGFRDLMDRLWAIDKADAEGRALVWILDLGRQDFEDPESRLRFVNVEALISRFKALKRFKESVTEARWNWLQSKTVIILHDTRSARPDVPRLPAFDPHHVLFSAIPPKWAGSPEFIALYGSERLHETIYTIFLKPFDKTGSSAEVAPPRHPGYELRFFGHALLMSHEKGQREARGLELNEPGRSYVEALGTVFVAAIQMLSPGNAPAELSINGMKIDAAHAIEKLRHHGFLLLRLDEFMRF